MAINWLPHPHIRALYLSTKFMFFIFFFNTIVECIRSYDLDGSGVSGRRVLVTVSSDSTSRRRAASQWTFSSPSKAKVSSSKRTARACNKRAESFFIDLVVTDLNILLICLLLSFIGFKGSAGSVCDRFSVVSICSVVGMSFSAGSGCGRFSAMSVCSFNTSQLLVRQLISLIV